MRFNSSPAYCNNGISENVWLLCIPLILVSFSVSIEPLMEVAQTLVLTICTILYALVNIRRLKAIDKRLFTLMLLYSLPWLLGFTFGIIGSIIGGFYEMIDKIDPFGRLVNITLTSLFLLCISMSSGNKSKFGSHLAVSYLIGSVIVLISAIWQALDLYTTLPVHFPFDTRSYIHSQGDLSIELKGRLTGFASEPSYLCPLLADGLLLSLLTIKNKEARILAVLLFSVVLFLTFSPSGYLTIIALFAVTMLSYSWRSRKARIRSLLIILLGFISLIFLQSTDAWQYFTYRLEGYEGSGRFQSIIEPIEFMFSNGNFLNIMFGFGTKSMGAFYYSGNDQFVFATSNTLFSDVLFDTGIIGLVSYLILLTILFLRCLRCARTNTMPLLLYTDLIITSLYRADYASLRFVALIGLIYVLSSGNRSPEESQVLSD